jgi:CubicO group peptidase (beta-lactamase class C family)
VKKETTTLSRATIEQLEKDIPEQMKKNGVPGLAMAVIGGGKTTWVHGFG